MNTAPMYLPIIWGKELFTKQHCALQIKKLKTVSHNQTWKEQHPVFTSEDYWRVHLYVFFKVITNLQSFKRYL